MKSIEIFGSKVKKHYDNEEFDSVVNYVDSVKGVFSPYLERRTEELKGLIDDFESLFSVNMNFSESYHFDAISNPEKEIKRREKFVNDANILLDYDRERLTEIVDCYRGSDFRRGHDEFMRQIDNEGVLVPGAELLAQRQANERKYLLADRSPEFYELGNQVLDMYVDSFAQLNGLAD